MNIKDFLISNSVDYTIYKLSVTELHDIIVYDKKVTQSVKTELVQYKEKYADWLDENKKEFSKSHKFLKNDLPTGSHKIRGIEPDTLQFDDCKTCDGHGTIICGTCSGKGELICPKCNGKTILQQVISKQRPITGQCQSCLGKGSFSFPCKRCGGFGSVKYYEPCQSCFGKGQIFNQQTQQWSYCQQCRGMGKLEKTAPCQSCFGKGQIIQNCTKCNGTGQFSGMETYQEKIDVPCTTCSSTGRVRCSTCNGHQELTCTTCNGERKTYQCYMNVFEVDVKNNYTLLGNRSLSKEAIDIIGIEPKVSVTKVDESEKQMLVNYGKLESLKIDKDSIGRVSGTLYKLESVESGEHYFIWYSKGKDKYFYNSLPPKNNFEELLVSIYRPVLKFLGKIYTWFSKIMKFLKNKKDY